MNFDILKGHGEILWTSIAEYFEPFQLYAHGKCLITSLYYQVCCLVPAQTRLGLEEQTHNTLH